MARIMDAPIPIADVDCRDLRISQHHYLRERRVTKATSSQELNRTGSPATQGFTDPSLVGQHPLFHPILPKAISKTLPQLMGKL